MRGLKKISEKYFLKYKEKPVKIKSYSTKQKIIADFYINKLHNLLEKYNPQLMIRGSTAFKILGKGEVEIGVYPVAKDWSKVLSVLSKQFGKPENLEENYARFNEIYIDKEVEIIVLRRHDAEVDIKLHKFLMANPKLLDKYAKLKKKYCFSKREYMIQKNKFLSTVVKQIPEDY